MPQTTQQEIRRSIDIEADLPTVWTLVSEPGWWINDGTLVEHRVEYHEDGRSCVVHDAVHGAFALEIVARDEPSYAAFRWHPTAKDDPSTLTEFSLAETAAGVTVTVVESDFDSLPASRVADFLRDNTEGWETELAALRTAVQARGGA